MLIVAALGVLSPDGLRRSSTSSQCRLETKGFYALSLRLNHNDYLSLEPAIYRAKVFSFIDLIILLYPATVSFYATAAPRAPEYTCTEGNGGAFSTAEGRIILRPRTLGV
jgi:hypothetical protein